MPPLRAMTPSGAALEEVRLSGDRAARPAKASSPPLTLMPPAIPSAPRASVPLSFASPPETERVWPVGMRRVPEAASSSPPERVLHNEGSAGDLDVAVHGRGRAVFG